jgi:flagellin-like hook-associated protein FlgL
MTTVQINQLQSAEQQLLTIEEQVSTGNAFQYLSQDPTAGIQGVLLQEEINQKTQVQTNLTTATGYMSTADSALTSVSTLINSIQSTVQSSIGTTATAADRTAAATQVQNAIQQLVNTGNQQYQGSYLFAGSETTSEPFTLIGSNVVYNGNTGALKTYSDIGQTLQTNVDGNSAFGAISAPVVGVDLNPNVTLSTQLSNLNNGNGVSLGSIEISDGSNSSTVDLSSAKSIGDVVGLIEANPPAGDKASVSVTNTGLDVQLTDSSSGAAKEISINEVGGGSTAGDLGILNVTGSSSGQITGQPLNPTLSLSTSLSDLLGTSATAVLASSGDNNDVAITAINHGTAGNNLAVSFVTNSSLAAGQVTVNYDTSNPSAPQLVFDVSPSGVTANAVVSALNSDSAVNSLFQASLVSSDTTSSVAAGTGDIDPTATATTAGGSGVTFDQSGLQVSNGGKTYTIDLSSAKTVQDVIDDINNSGANLTASFNATGNGLSVTSNLSGSDFSIGENGGSTATELGLRTFTNSTQLADLNHGEGVSTAGAGLSDFTIQRPDGTSFSVSLSGANTIGDVINDINNNTNNQGSNQVTAKLNATGNGIELVSNDITSTKAPFQVIVNNNSLAAQDLGLVAAGATTSATSVVGSASQTISGTDTNPQEVDGLFNSLSKLYTALQDDDTPEIGRDLGLLQNNLTQLGFAQAELGARQQYLQTAQTKVSNDLTILNSNYSNDVNVDMTTAATQLSTAEISYQATLQVTALVSKQSLLNYL